MREGLSAIRVLRVGLAGAIALTGCGGSQESAAGARPETLSSVDVLASVYEPITGKELNAASDTVGYDGVVYTDRSGAVGVQGVVTRLENHSGYAETVADSACGTDGWSDGVLEAKEVSGDEDTAVHQEFTCSKAGSSKYFKQDVTDVKLDLERVSSKPSSARVYQLEQSIASTDENQKLEGWITQESDWLVGQNCVSSSSEKGELEGRTSSRGGGILLGPVGAAGGGSSGSISGSFDAKSQSDCAGVTTARIGVSYNVVDDGSVTHLSVDADGKTISIAGLRQLEAGFKNRSRGLEPDLWDTAELPECQFFTTGEGKNSAYRAKDVGETCVRYASIKPTFTGEYRVSGLTNEAGDPLCTSLSVKMQSDSDRVKVVPSLPDEVVKIFIPQIDAKKVVPCKVAQ